MPYRKKEGKLLPLLVFDPLVLHTRAVHVGDVDSNMGRVGSFTSRHRTFGEHEFACST